MTDAEKIAHHDAIAAFNWQAFLQMVLQVLPLILPFFNQPPPPRT